MYEKCDFGVNGEVAVNHHFHNCTLLDKGETMGVVSYSVGGRGLRCWFFSYIPHSNYI